MDGIIQSFLDITLAQTLYLFAPCPLDLLRRKHGSYPGTSHRRTPQQDEIRVSKFSLEEDNLILAFHSDLIELCRVPSPSTPEYVTSDAFPVVRARILDFGLLSLTKLREIESRLRNTWDRFDQRARMDVPGPNCCLEKFSRHEQSESRTPIRRK